MTRGLQAAGLDVGPCGLGVHQAVGRQGLDGAGEGAQQGPGEAGQEDDEEDQEGHSGRQQAEAQLRPPHLGQGQVHVPKCAGRPCGTVNRTYPQLVQYSVQATCGVAMHAPAPACAETVRSITFGDESSATGESGGAPARVTRRFDTVAPQWLDGLTWWHVYPLGFSGAEPESGQAHGVVHRLRHLSNWLDYAHDLGCRGLQLGPIFASETHGYDTTDHLHIDHRLGDERDFDALVRGCHDRGMRLLLDGVFNHVGYGHPMFQVARAAGPDPQGAGAQAARWFDLRWPDAGGEPDYDVFEGHGNLVTLNHEDPAVINYVVHVMDHWLTRGADGWRLDAAYAVAAGVLARGPVPGARRCTPTPGSSASTSTASRPQILAETTLDSVTAYGLWRPLWRSLNEAQLLRPHLADRAPGRVRQRAPAPDLRRQPRHDPHRQQPGGPAPLRPRDRRPVHAARHPRRSTTATSRRSGASRRTGSAATRPCDPMFPDRPDGLAPWGWPIHHLHRQLIEMRSRHPWMTRSQVTIAHVTNTSLALQVATAGGQGRRITTLLNIADEPATFPVELPDPTIEVQSDGAAHEPDLLVVPGHAWRVLSHGAPHWA